jgi:hypothetical protein
MLRHETPDIVDNLLRSGYDQEVNVSFEQDDWR